MLDNVNQHALQYYYKNKIKVRLAHLKKTYEDVNDDYLIALIVMNDIIKHKKYSDDIAKSILTTRRALLKKHLKNDKMIQKYNLHLYNDCINSEDLNQL